MSSFPQKDLTTDDGSLKYARGSDPPTRHPDVTGMTADPGAAAGCATGAPRLALAGTFTVEPVVETLGLVLDAIALDLEIEVTPYAQVFQELLDPGRTFARNAGGVNVVLVRLEDWWGHAPPDGPPPTDDSLSRPLDDLVEGLRQATASGPAPVAVVVCPPSPRWTRDPVRRARHDALEQRLAAALAPLRGVRLVPRPPIGASAEDETRDVYDEEGDRLGHVPYRPRYFAALALAVARAARAVLAPPRKVLALDCDNTLWKGVVGEDGVEGIEIGARELALQEFALGKKREGMLLCLVSKNAAEDVDAVLAGRADMRLRAEDLASLRVNWLPKSQNLESLAAELNLGLDSFVFVDDNPIECAEVAAACPGVLTVTLPEASAPDDEAAGRSLAAFLDGLWPLDHLDVTEEDRRRTELYRENRERSRVLETSTSPGRLSRGARPAGHDRRAPARAARARRAAHAADESVQPHDEAPQGERPRSARRRWKGVSRRRGGGSVGRLRPRGPHGAGPRRWRRRGRHAPAELPHPGPRRRDADGPGGRACRARAGPGARRAALRADGQEPARAALPRDAARGAAGGGRGRALHAVGRGGGGGAGVRAGGGVAPARRRRRDDDRAPGAREDRRDERLRRRSLGARFARELATPEVAIVAASSAAGARARGLADAAHRRAPRQSVSSWASGRSVAALRRGRGSPTTSSSWGGRRSTP